MMQEREKSASWRLGRLLGQVVLAPSRCAAGQDPNVAGEGDPAFEEYRQRLAGGGRFEPPEEKAWEAYREEAVKRAADLGNRGPLRYDADGNVAKEIQEAYYRCGFYVFESLISPEEVAEAQAEFEERLENAPVEAGSKLDKQGRPVKFPFSYDMVKPHKGSASDSGEVIAGNLMHPLMTMQSALRLYAHPDIMRMNECFNGYDFTPMYSSIFHKAPGKGQATSWHQDGRTHWHPDTGLPGRQDGKLPPRQPGAVYPEEFQCHGNSFHVALSNCVPEQCLWLVPGSHKQIFWPHWADGKFNTSKGNHLVHAVFPSGWIEMLPTAVPMLMRPGDVGIHNRQCVHGAFPNSSSERRVTLVQAYYNRRYVQDQRARDSMGKKEAQLLMERGHKFEGYNNDKLVMGDQHIRDKTRIIQIAIDARKERYPDETPYVYKPHQGEAMPPREEYIKNYSFTFGLLI